MLWMMLSLLMTTLNLSNIKVCLKYPLPLSNHEITPVLGRVVAGAQPLCWNLPRCGACVFERKLNAPRSLVAVSVLNTSGCLPSNAMVSSVHNWWPVDILRFLESIFRMHTIQSSMMLPSILSYSSNLY
jgi:hypothetical protein